MWLQKILTRGPCGVQTNFSTASCGSDNLKLSTERVLTTHVGSLPRSQPVVDMLLQRESGQGYPRAEFERVMDTAVSEVVRRQRQVGIDVVSDGETAKIGYATYIKDRLSGFAGENASQGTSDPRDHRKFS